MSLSILFFFGIVFLLVYLLRAAKIGALVAFLLTGILSGPYVLNLFNLTETWSFLADIGILFLWFSIGLEINMRRLWNLRRIVFGFGASQVLMVVVMLFPLLFGVTNWGVLGCVMIAMLLAMSSTSADLQLLSDRHQLNTDMGRQTFSILLFQDLLSIPLLAMLPVFTGKTFSLGAMAIDVVVISVALVIAVMVLGRFVITPLLRQVARLKSKEAFLLAVILNIVLWAVLIDFMGLPSGLGAFLAGMLMSETIYRHQISAEISPYSILFLGLFFVSLGMGLNLDLILSNWYIVLFGTIALMVIKFFAMFMVARVRGIDISSSIMTALILSQGGEFALLMLQTMKFSGIEIIPASHKEILTAVIVLSIMLTPLVIGVYSYLQRTGRISSHRFVNTDNKNSDIVPQVVVCGFGRVGQIVCQMLDALSVPYVAVDLDVSSVMMGREQGFNVIYGDSTNRDVLLDCGLAPRKTKGVVIALDNATTARAAILTIKSIGPRIKIFARARNLADSKILVSEGADVAMPETIESSFFLGYSILSQIGFSDSDIDSLLNEMRADDYAALSMVVSDKQD